MPFLDIYPQCYECAERVLGDGDAEDLNDAQRRFRRDQLAKAIEVAVKDWLELEPEVMD